MYKFSIFSNNNRKKRRFFMINFRTDLATERREIYRKANKIENEIPGVETRRI